MLLLGYVEIITSRFSLFILITRIKLFILTFIITIVKFSLYSSAVFCSALEPTSLSKAIYPVLTSYASPDKEAYPRHSLSRAALITSGSPIFLLDAFTNLIVYYSSSAEPSLPFPPPHDCRHSITVLFTDISPSHKVITEHISLFVCPFRSTADDN